MKSIDLETTKKDILKVEKAVKDCNAAIKSVESIFFDTVQSSEKELNSIMQLEGLKIELEKQYQVALYKQHRKSWV